jgi:hypothetical protein
MADAMHVLLVRGDGHAAVVDALRGVHPNLRWISSYELTGGSVDAVDVIVFAEHEDPEAARRAAAAVPGVEVELLPATPSVTLFAPGGGMPPPPGSA